MKYSQNKIKDQGSLGGVDLFTQELNQQPRALTLDGTKGGQLAEMSLSLSATDQKYINPFDETSN